MQPRWNRKRVPIPVAAILSLVLVGDGGAQIPGESAYGPKISMRQQYLAQTFEEVRGTLNEWQELIRKRDLNRLKKMVTDEVLFSQADGTTLKGKEAVGDSLALRLPRIGGYGLIPEDFDASGEVAYIMGSVRYDLQHPTRPTTVSGNFMMVLFQRGPNWRIRSYIERVDLPSPAP